MTISDETSKLKKKKKSAKYLIIEAFQRREDSFHLKAFPICFDSKYKEEYGCWAELCNYVHRAVRS